MLEVWEALHVVLCPCMSELAQVTMIGLAALTWRLYTGTAAP
jgi:hypothetical protein